ncbi:tRNA (guanosine(37)-N1)-methyltransferase TrmD [Murdochiella massiliensis]|uniref:tRNA (guanosine(37)-N1)-methyltransferase TrmD n=1 Tax=Murdochiella massiliensis TaxID=1673723 RepID=UPI000834953A|nr:tRNA (guanosine(37)-N1)-methyltransferase TrmD [Murdochiella massiliensis]MBY0584351.1 tRNA (guanosine(37)-N1)-methyltransferase TrmD [Murdochiella sp. Marseille-P8839]
MKIDILTLFPELFDLLRAYGVIGRALESGILTLKTHQIRDYAKDRHKSVDDTVFGGAAGMLMKPDVLYDALDAVRTPASHVVFLSPQGSVLNQDKARALAQYDHLVLLCGHYEGIDARITNYYVDEEISIGDYVLTGGELPAMVLVDTVVRWVDDVLGNPESAASDSHANLLLQYDEYTKPRNFRGHEVPDVLLNGNHQAIAAWRNENALYNTKRKRPDLYERYLRESGDEGGIDGLH